MGRTLIRLILACILAATFSVAVAQDDDDATDYAEPLLTMLSRVPDIAPSKGDMIMYQDRDAIVMAYPGAEGIASWEQWSLLSDAAESPDHPLFARNVWWRIFMNVSAGGTYMQFAMSEGDRVPEVLGFDLFDVQREIAYGRPPEQALIIELDYDAEGVPDALAALDYNLADDDVVDLWCGPTGCDGGNDIDFETRDPANIFGGDLGRKQPIVLGDGYLMSSPALSIVAAHASTQNGEITSLAENPLYQSAVEAVTGEGPIIQAWFLEDEILDEAIPASVDAFALARPPEAIGDVAREMLDAGYADMPRFDLIMAADTATDDQHVTYLALVYEDAEFAQMAADAIPARIEGYTSLRTRMTYADMLADSLIDDISTSVVETESGLAVTLIRFGTRKGTPEEIIQRTNVSLDDEEMDIVFPGRMFRLLTDGVFMRDLGWLSTFTRSQLESMASD